MDLFGDIDDISSESDDDNQLLIPGQPAASTVTTPNWSHCSRLMGPTPSCGEGTWVTGWQSGEWVTFLISYADFFWILMGKEGTA